MDQVSLKGCVQLLPKSDRQTADLGQRLSSLKLCVSITGVDGSPHIFEHHNGCGRVSG
jgi:hypothetical protein